MKTFLTSLLCLASIIFISQPASAQFGEPLDPFGFEGGGEETSTSSVISNAESVAPGEKFKIALKLSHPTKWHSYYHNDGIGISMIPSVDWKLPAGFKASALHFPTPHVMDSFGLDSYGYDGTNYFITEITAPADLKVGDSFEITANAVWQICKESCVKEEGQHTLNFTVSESTIDNPAYSAELTDYQKKYIPTQAIPSDWTITASEKDKLIEIKIASSSKLPDDTKFYEYNGQLDAQNPINITSEQGALTISGKFNEGNDFSPDPAEKLDHISGILHSPSTPLSGENHSIFITSAWEGGFTPTNATSSSADTTSTPQKAISLDGSTEKSFTLITVIPFALLAGLILNIMPCVFPVLGLKITGFAQQAGEDSSKIKWHGITFGLGVVVSMWALAGVLITLKLLGNDIGWGFHLQSPIALSIILIIMFIMGLNLSGLFEMGTKLTSVGGDLQQKKGYSGSFFSGLLTTLIATPCSAPIVAPVMGYATGLDPIPALFVFTIFALGIASPYIILSFMPKLIQKLPRPGAWMVTFKKIMAFPMYAAVIFFFGAFMTLTGKSGAQWLLWSFLIIAIALYIYGQWALPYKPKATRYKAIIFTLLFAGLAFWTTNKAVHTIPPTTAGGKIVTEDGFVWEEWSIEKVAELRASGKRVYVDFTADNCLTCKANKNHVFTGQNAKDLRKFFLENDVVALRADWTHANPDITRTLREEFNRSSIPVNVIYPASLDKPAILLPTYPLKKEHVEKGVNLALEE
ncbi:MAG: protein-disulfide reductase DsbD family protein [Akkermansiaceae bacterium]